MEIQSPFIDFTFDSGTSTPYITAPSSPQRFGNFYFTNPAAADVTDHHHYLDDLARASFSISPSLWENKPKTSAAGGSAINSDDFEFALKLERDSASADELFHSGKIKPLEPPEPPKSTPESYNFSDGTEKSKFLRVSDILAEEEDDGEEISDECSSLSPISSSDKASNNPFGSFLATFSLSKGYRKWSFKDFLLFRSASEGRGTNKDPLRKFAALHHGRNPSLGSVGSSVSSRRGPKGVVSAHEMHYTANRAAAEEMKKKTTLAYRQGVLGCLAFNPNTPSSGGADLAKQGFVGSLPRG